MPERFPPDDPREWLSRARSDLILAKAAGVGIYLEDLCFHAQQGYPSLNPSDKVQAHSICRFHAVPRYCVTN